MKRIIGERFNELFCSADTLCLDLGDNFADEDGDPMPAYSLNIVGDCHFEKEGKILLSLADIYADHGTNGSASVKDPRFVAVREALVGTRVSEATLTETGTLTVLFDNGISFVFHAVNGAYFGLYPHHCYEPSLFFGDEKKHTRRIYSEE
jgi:hypothetical protein